MFRDEDFMDDMPIAKNVALEDPSARLLLPIQALVAHDVEWAQKTL